MSRLVASLERYGMVTRVAELIERMLRADRTESG
jgi:hypothetical protein